MENEKKTSFFGEYFKKCYFIPTLFYTAIFASAILVNINFGIISKLAANSLYLTTIIAISYFGLFLFSNFISCIKRDKIVQADSIAFACILTPLAYIAYFTLILHDFNIKKIIIFGALAFISLIYIILRLIFFKSNKKASIIYYTKNNLNGYVLAFARNYSFIAVIIFSIVIFLISFIILDSKYAIPFDDPNFLQYCILAGIVLAFLVIGSTFRRLTLLDPTLLATVISIPPTYVYICLMQDKALSSTYLMSYSIFAFAIIFFYIVKLSTFDLTKIEKSSTVKKYKCPVFDYIFSYSKKYSLLLTISAVPLFVLGVRFFVKYFPIITNTLADPTLFSYIFFVVAFTTIIFFGMYFIGLILSLFNIRAVKLTYGDFFTVFTFIFSIYMFFTFDNVITQFDKFIAAGLFVLALTVLIARIKQYHKRAY